MQPVRPVVGPRARSVRSAVLLVGLILPQVLLYGPSLLGRKLLLPLDLLALTHYYLPPTGKYASVTPYDFTLSDEVLLFEFERRFAATEFRAGRVPLWTPDIFLGAPYAVWGKYAPFNALYYAWPSPVTLAWMQLLKSLLAGIGAYLFFRRVVRVGFWPAVIGAWCYPLLGFFTLWQGYPQSEVTAWLPWLFLATDAVIGRPLGWTAVGLALITCVVLITRVDVAAQALLACGLFALWRLWQEYGRPFQLGRLAGTGAVTAAAWLLGFMLAAPYLLPLAEYTRHGERIAHRAAGQEERPPGGIAELPRLVLPEVYGAPHRGSCYLTDGNLLESGAGAYVGLIATLLLVPLAWASRAHRGSNIFWTVLAVLALGWTLNIPGVVTLLRAPGLKLLSHNRLTFVAAFALLSLAVTGLEVVGQGGAIRHGRSIVPAVALVALAGWCGLRAAKLPEPLATQLEAKLNAGQETINVPDFVALEQARTGFVRTHLFGVGLCAAALAGWCLIWWGGMSPAVFTALLAVLMMGELFGFAYGRNPQCDPDLYYPPLQVFQDLRAKPPGRVLGVDCLPANLPALQGLRDIRGYDSIDPHALMQLLDSVRIPGNEGTPYAHVQWYRPRMDVAENGGILLPPPLSMCGVRYVIFRGKPAEELKPILVEDDYWVVENAAALPRAFVPQHVLAGPDGSRLYELLDLPTFNARKLAYVDRLVSLPATCAGEAAVSAETPRQVTVEADMKTPGLVVLADLWYPGWQAECNGQPAAILRTNGVLRGVVAPQGKSIIVFRYEPASFATGMRLFALAAALLLAWSVLSTLWARRRAAVAAA